MATPFFPTPEIVEEEINIDGPFAPATGIDVMIAMRQFLLRPPALMIDPSEQQGGGGGEACIYVGG